MSPGALEVPVYYDFASSLCYVAHVVMARMRGELDALGLELRWRPLDLVGITGWRRGEPISGLRRDNVLRVARELRVDLRLPGRWMDSRRAGAVALALGGGAVETAWRERVWRAVYEQGRSLDDPDWQAALADELGLDSGAGEERRARAALEAETALAREAEVSGVPTFVLGGWPLGGIQDEATMRSLLGRYATRARRVH